MPALSPTMEQGNLIAWKVRQGDEVEAGTELADIETDKATLGACPPLTKLKVGQNPWNKTDA